MLPDRLQQLISSFSCVSASPLRLSEKRGHTTGFSQSRREHAETQRMTDPPTDSDRRRPALSTCTLSRLVASEISGAFGKVIGGKDTKIDVNIQQPAPKTP